MDPWNAAHSRIKRGLAITPVKFGISFTYTAYNQAGALVLIYRDGTVQVNHGMREAMMRQRKRFQLTMVKVGRSARSASRRGLPRRVGDEPGQAAEG